MKPEFSYLVEAALQANGSLVNKEQGSRNRENHEKTLAAVLVVLAIRRMKRGLGNVPKEVMEMLGTTLWKTKCDVNAWTKT